MLINMMTVFINALLISTSVHVFPKQDIQINLTSASNGGRIGNNNVFTLSILPNDNPHGTVEFQLDNFHLQEKATESTQYITLIRR